ncbi:transglutaminase domain-containing protein, partial [candidate division WOR-3 bacterium]|nr:transglutaminase domain-containing protein [candidate division WOR-3 bacterium]
DTKIGYTVLRYQRVQGGYEFENLMQMTVGMMGRPQRLRVWSRVQTGPDLALRRFEFELGSQDGSYRASGVADDSGLTVAGGPSGGERRIRTSGTVYPIEALGRVVVGAGIAPGDTLEFMVFDGTVMDVLPTRVTMVGPARDVVGTESVAALQVKVTRAKFEVTSWIDSLGLTVREESPIGMWSIRTSPDSALAGEPDGARLDVLAMFRVPVDTSADAPAAKRRAVLEVSGLDTALFGLGGGRQSVVSAAPLRVEVRTGLPLQPVTLPVAGMDEYLSPTVSLQCDDPEIRARARGVAGAGRDAATVARALLEWVFRSLEKRATASFPSARDVLASMRGDCNEHSVLYAAMARSVGLPCRVAVGLVYLDRAFYYHAWNEVYLGEWVPVDATFGEFPAGALRLRLATGEVSSQAEILGVVQRIRLRVVEFE